jgi:glycosyltransferase involved in cell wall biosynthesis
LTRRGIVFVVNAEIVGGAERHAAALARGLAARGFSTDLFALRRAGEAPRRTRDLRAHVRTHGSGLVVAVNERPALLAAFGGLRREARVVGVLHSTVPRNGFERLVRFAHLPALYALDALVFVSERQRAYWRRAGLLKASQTIRNGVDVRRFAPDARR